MGRVDQLVFKRSKKEGADLAHQFVTINVLLFQLFYSIQ